TQSILIRAGSILAQVPWPPVSTAAAFRTRCSSMVRAAPCGLRPRLGTAALAFSSLARWPTRTMSYVVPACWAAWSMRMRLPQLFTRALFFAKTISGRRLNCGGQFTVMDVLRAADLPASSVTVTVAVTLLLWFWPPPSKFKDEASKVALGLLLLAMLPSLTVQL